MEQTSALAAWDNFYVIVGSSAAALTGLQFVVMTLIGADQNFESGMEEVNAFGTPNVVHFCAALLVSAILSAPWHTLHGPAVGVTVCGIAGLGYVALVARRAVRQPRYRPVLEDWIWHALLPTVAYLTLLVAALAAWTGVWPLFAIAGAALLLVFIGIHNAWDTVTYITVERRRK
jgi:divalent metal cation (Fe/Co/Zn/Cd) transporter